MTNDKNDGNNWVVAMMGQGEGACLQILHTEQAENIARQKAEEAALHYVGVSVFLYQRVATVRTEPVARWL